MKIEPTKIHKSHGTGEFKPSDYSNATELYRKGLAVPLHNTIPQASIRLASETLAGLVEGATLQKKKKVCCK